MKSDNGQSKGFTKPPFLAFEPERLAELYALDILDTAFEDRFDRYTELLASLYDFPICLVTLVDEDRQWFKSNHGLDFRETKRDRSFCAHALAHDDVFLVPDTKADPRFANNPLVVNEPYARFYAGSVIHGPNGLPLGTLCLLDRKPRTFSDRDCRHLRLFADLVERELHYNHEIKMARQDAEEAAYSDALTGLPNRRLFEDRLAQFIQMARTQKGAPFTVLHIDVVDFLRVNRSLGREAGDEVLLALAERLRRLCPEEGTLARLRADCFAMAIPQARHEDQGPGTLMGRLARELKRPIVIDRREQFLRLRIGAAVYRDKQDSGPVTSEGLLEQAAAAARSSGDQSEPGVSVHFHDPAMESRLERQFELESRMRSALEYGRFTLAYQPVFDINTNRIVSLEALIRWEEPTLGNISPGEFIPLAEATGLILPMGQWVLGEALRQYRQWQDQGVEPLPIHVNLSARELEYPDFVDRVTAFLSKADVPGRALCLEITETVLIQDLEDNAAKMAQLTEHGVRFYIDDFGKGYSSLQYLRQLPFAALKIDRAFVSQVTENPDDAAIARAVIALGQSLGVTVIAEGVETEEQLAFLQDVGCELAQGFLLARPMSADKMLEVFKQNGRDKD